MQQPQAGKAQQQTAEVREQGDVAWMHGIMQEHAWEKLNPHVKAHEIQQHQQASVLSLLDKQHISDHMGVRRHGRVNNSVAEAEAAVNSTQ